jgi:hypothetical protein
MRSATTYVICTIIVCTILCIILLGTVAMAQKPGAIPPIPTIEQPLVPSAAQPGGAGFTLTINGAGLAPPPNAVLWTQGTNTTQLTITSSNDFTLKATVPAANIAAAGTAWVSVLSGLSTSNVEYFQIATPASPQFTPPVGYSIDGTAFPASVLAADFNGDGILDLAVGVSADTDVVCILLGIGNGSFQTPAPCYEGAFNQGATSSMVAGVFNNNGGFVDIVAGDVYLKNNGQGVFTASGIGVADGFIAYAVGDFSQTGSLDIAGTMNGNVQILNNDGTGTFTLGQSFTGSITQFGDMVTADFNGDGILDLAVLDIYAGGPAIRVFLGALGTAPEFNPDPVVTNIAQPGPISFAAADFNGDGKQDLVVTFDTNGDYTVSPSLGNGDGTFTLSTGFSLNFPTGPIVTADFNEDGKLDFATGTAVVLGNGDGTFQTPIYFEGDADQQILATGDFNDDGRPDLIAPGANGGIVVYLQQTTAAPVVSLAPTSVSFGSQNVGTSSAQAGVTITNTGNAVLGIDSLSITGTNASEFSVIFGSCSASLAAGSSCTFDVTFTPTAAGAATASVSIADNAAGTPQMVPLTGTGTAPSPQLTTTCTSLTVVPGQTAIFTVDLTPLPGVTQSVSLSCSGEPTLATCTPASSTMTLSGTATVPVQITATTTQATGFLQPPPLGRSDGSRMAGLVGLAGIAGFAALVVLPGKRRMKPARRLHMLIFLLCMLATLAILPSCGRGSDPPGTAAGTYPLTVTGTFTSDAGTVTETVSFNLVVQ